MKTNGIEDIRADIGTAILAVMVWHHFGIAAALAAVVVVTLGGIAVTTLLRVMAEKVNSTIVVIAASLVVWGITWALMSAYLTSPAPPVPSP